MPDTTYAKQITSQLGFYQANSPRAKDAKSKISDQTLALINILAEFDKLAGKASSLTGDALKSAQAQAGDLLQQTMNQFGLLCDLTETLKTYDANHPTEGSGALAMGTVSEKQAKGNAAADSAYLDNVSLVLLTMQANVAAIQDIGLAVSD